MANEIKLQSFSRISTRQERIEELESLETYEAHLELLELQSEQFKELETSRKLCEVKYTYLFDIYKSMLNIH